MPDLVAIDMPAGPGFVAVLERAWARGDAVFPLEQQLPVAVRTDLLAEIRPSRIVGPGPDDEHAWAGGVGVEAGDALVVATSSTTGTAKGVVLTHAAVAASAEATTKRLGVDPSRHRWLSCLRLNHIGGLAVVTRSLLTGTPLEVLSGFSVPDVVARSGPDVYVSLVNTALARVGAEQFHTVLLGGSAPPPELPPNVVTTYGLTETGSGVVYDGVPLEGVEVDIDTGTGHIRLRGPMLLRAYRDGRNPLDPAGWLPTGDAGHFDAQGRLVVAGRLSDMIITGGENVWPAPVEAALRLHPGVADVAVAGRPDPEWGETVVAWVVPRDPNSPPALAELRVAAAEAVARYALPRQVIIVDDLPRTSMGKLRRHLLTPS